MHPFSESVSREILLRYTTCGCLRVCLFLSWSLHDGLPGIKMVCSKLFSFSVFTFLLHYLSTFWLAPEKCGVDVVLISLQVIGVGFLSIFERPYFLYF